LRREGSDIVPTSHSSGKAKAMQLQTIIQVIVACAVLLFFIWLLIPNRKAGSTDNAGSPFINPDDTRQIALLVGLKGGSIPDAAVMRFALERFKQKYRRRATTRDIGIVLGLIDSVDS
jgi:hypothetical protein